MSQRRAHRAAQTPRLCDDMVENGQDDGASTQKLHILLLPPLLLRDVPAYYDTSTFFRFFSLQRSKNALMKKLFAAAQRVKVECESREHTRRVRACQA